MEHIVMPYRFSEYDELRYVIRSIEQNLKFDYDITIIGDLPEWATNIKHIPYNDTDYKRYENLFNKLEIAMNMYDKFIWWHDDEFVLKPITLDELKKVYYLQDLNDVGKFGSRWFQQELKRFRDKMNELDLPAYNYCTHTPFYFESDKLKEVLDYFGITEKKELTFIENYYFNYFKKHNDAEKIYDVKIGRYDSKPIEPDEWENKIFANFDEDGIESGIFDKLKSMFNKPSKYEKLN